MGKDLNPVSEETTIMGKDLKPVGEETKTMCEDAKPAIFIPDLTDFVYNPVVFS